MKTKLFTLLVATLLISSISFAKIWRVNNTGANANFTTANAAFTSASVKNGDTVYFEASNIDYASAGYTVTKQLTLIGPGYFLALAPTPLQYNPNTALLSSLIIQSKNVSVIGLKIDNLTLYGPPYSVDSSNNCLISRCLLNYLYLYGDMNTILITQNFIRALIQNPTGNSISSVLITNNIVGDGVYFYSLDNGIIEYNDFGMNNDGADFTFNGASFAFRNNIIRGTGNTKSTFSNVLFSNNMAQQANFLPAGNGNVNSVVMSGTSMFADGTKSTTTNDGDTYYQLSATSPAKTAGAGGTPIGAYAGTSPYVSYGIPPIPTIYSLTLPTSTSSGNTLQVNFSSRSNQ